MSTIPVNLAIEDYLSEAVLRRLLAHANRAYSIGTVYGRSGFGYLRRTVHGWNRAARGIPFVLLTDLDRYQCPQALLNDWLQEPRHPNLVLRIAVREVESWLLADRANLAEFLAVPERLLPRRVEALSDPKAVLIGLARRSRRRDVRERIVPRRGSTAQIGPDYNGCLMSFVMTNWDIGASADESRSLSHTLARLRSFAPVWPGSTERE